MKIKRYAHIGTNVAGDHAAQPGCLRLIVKLDTRTPVGPGYRIYDDAGLLKAGEYATANTTRAWRKITRRGQRALKLLQREVELASRPQLDTEVVVNPDRYVEATA